MPNERGRVRLLSRFEEIGDRDVEVTEDMWAEVLPELVHVEVVLNKDEYGAGGIASGRATAGVPVIVEELVPQRATYPGQSNTIPLLRRGD